MELNQYSVVKALNSLAEIEQYARNAFSTARYFKDTPGLRTLKMNLAGLHSDHLHKIRERIYAMGGPSIEHGARTSDPAVWTQLQAAMVSSRPQSVSSACINAERQVAQLYESLLHEPGLDESLQSFLHEQLEEIREASENIGQSYCVAKDAGTFERTARSGNFKQSDPTGRANTIRRIPSAKSGGRAWSFAGANPLS